MSPCNPAPQPEYINHASTSWLRVMYAVLGITGMALLVWMLRQLRRRVGGRGLGVFKSPGKPMARSV